MKYKKIWIILLVVGIIPLLIPLIGGIYYSTTGFNSTLICIADCDYYYGFKALRDSIVLYSYVFWPTYVVGAILIVLSIMKLRIKKK